MKHYVQLTVSTLILLAVAKAAEEPPLPSQCTVSLMQTDLRLKILKEEAAPHSPVKSIDESEGKPPPNRHVEEPAQSSFAQALKDVGEGHQKAKKSPSEAKASSDTEHLVELKASSEYAEKSSLQQATSEEQSKTIDIRLNSELQTESHMKADNTAQKAHNTAPAQLAEKDKEATSLKASSDTEHLVELKASSEYAKKSRSEADSKKEAEVGTIDFRSSAKDSHVAAPSANDQARSSYTARTVAWLKNSVMVQDSSGSFLMILFAGVLCCICVTTMLMETQMQDPNNKHNNDRPPPPGAFAGGRNARPTPLNSAMEVPGAYSQRQLPTTPQLSLRTLPSQQRTPVRSSAVLPPGANMMENLRSSPSVSGELPQPGIRFDLPPICPSLILPHTEARFMIQMDHLHRSWQGTLNILGTSGRKLLHAVVCDAPDNRRCLMLASCGCEDDPRTCIFTPADTTDPQAELEVFGKSGEFYGWLEFPGGNLALLTHSGNDGETNRVLKIDMGNATDIRMSASTMDGKLLASAGRSVGDKLAEGKDTWKMQVKPGADAVLITSCMLALIFLKPWPSGGGFTPQGTATSLR